MKRLRRRAPFAIIAAALLAAIVAAACGTFSGQDGNAGNPSDDASAGGDANASDATIGVSSDAGVGVSNDAGRSADAGGASSLCSNTTAEFCDDFENAPDAAPYGFSTETASSVATTVVYDSTWDGGHYAHSLLLQTGITSGNFGALVQDKFTTTFATGTITFDLRVNEDGPTYPATEVIPLQVVVGALTVNLGLEGNTSTSSLLEWSSGGNGGNPQISPASISVDTWHHVVLALDLAVGKICSIAITIDSTSAATSIVPCGGGGLSLALGIPGETDLTGPLSVDFDNVLVQY